jgi:hypothetical protein
MADRVSRAIAELPRKVLEQALGNVVIETTSEKRWRVVDRWNGGAGGAVVRFTSKSRGTEGHNECFVWIHRNTPFSFHEAVTRQGYHVEQVD